jgi:hypothetical protein
MTRSFPLTALLWTLAAASAAGQEPRGFTYGVDWRGPLLAQVPSGSTTGNRINEADVLTFGPGAPGPAPLGPPAQALTGDLLGIAGYAACLDHLPFTPCGIEVDALSQGMDAPLLSGGATRARGGLVFDDLWFSVDERSAGQAGLPLNVPSVRSESFVADASADVFVALGIGAGPVGPGTLLGRNVGVFDGDGLPSAQPSGSLYPGLGITEPNPADVSPPLGDTLDSLDIDAVLGFPPGGQYFSLDGAFTDPASGLQNSGSAQAQGVSPADVLFVATPGGTVQVYAPATTLGLGLLGLGADDLDALALRENGVPGFQPSQQLYDWEAGTSDLILFSVRRGSAVVGRPDSLFGAPIEPGDVLIPPIPAAAGGLSPFPAIFYSAESLGLATQRSGQSTFGDDLNALDITAAPCFDCNNNGVEDAVDISLGTSSDVNKNGIPDECERIREYCECPPAAAPCSNPADGAGCANSTGAGGHLFFTGTSRVSADDLVLTAEDLPPNKFAIHYMATGQVAVPLGDGLRCAGGGPTFRFGVQNSGAGGLVDLGPGLVATSCASFPPAGCITAGATWNFQVWYRDPAGPCGAGFNWSNGIEVQFVP